MFDSYESRDNYNELMSELESLGVGNTSKPKLNDLNDSYEIGNLVDNIKQKYIKEYKSASIVSD